jgi:hypothetical protein
VSAPAVHIVLTLEDPPRVVFDFRNDGEERRMMAWLVEHVEYARLVDEALELARLERAA